MKKRVFILMVLNLFWLQGCGLKNWIAKEFMQGNIADGLARLSSQHASMIVSQLMIKFDEDSPALEIIPSEKEGEFNKGLVRWTLSDTEINYEQETAVYTDCHGDKGYWQGKLKIKHATKEMYGLLTNNPKKPVIPDPNTLKVYVDAEVDNLTIRFPAKDGYLSLESGQIKFDAEPRLAQDSSGLRVVPTSNTKLDNIRLIDIKGLLTSSELTIPVEIYDSMLNMQIGMGENGDENKLEGWIQLFGNIHKVPMDKSGLDPDYEQQAFISTYSCNQALIKGISYENKPAEVKLALGVAGYSSAIISTVLSRLETDRQCGFLSSEVYGKMQPSGAAGQEGYILSSIENDCVLDFDNFVSAPNCFGMARKMSGQVTIKRADRKFDGIIISEGEDYKTDVAKFVADNDAGMEPDANPFVAPVSSTPLLINSEIALKNITIVNWCTDDGNTADPRHCKNQKPEEETIFHVKDAQIKSGFVPVLAKTLAKDAEAQVCSIPTPAGQAEVFIEQMNASIEKGPSNILLNPKGKFKLVNGPMNHQENALSGSLKLGAVNVDFKTDKQNFVSLDEKYERQKFLDSFVSCQEIRFVKSDDECMPEEYLSENMARMVVANAGSLLKIAGSSAIKPSFSSLGVVSRKKLLNNENTLVLEANSNDNQDLNSPQFATISHSVDDYGNKTNVFGHIENFSSRMTRHGKRIHPKKSFLSNLNPARNILVEGVLAKRSGIDEIFVRPTYPKATTIEVSAQVKDFVAEIIAAGQDEAKGKLIFESGNLSVVAKPVMKAHSKTIGTENPSYSVATVDVDFQEIKLSQIKAVFKGGNMILPVYIEEASLKAHAGFYQNEGNFVLGNLRYSIGKMEHKPRPAVLVNIPQTELVIGLKP